MKIKSEARNQEVINLFNQGIAFSQIGHKFKISRERVRQIVGRQSPEGYKQYKAAKLAKKLCNNCGGDKQGFYRRDYPRLCEICYRQKKPKFGWSRNYEACIDCGTIKGRNRGGGRCNPCYYRYVYHNVPGVKERVYKYNRLWRKNNPDAWLKIVRKAVNKYHKKLRKDPEKYDIYLKKQRDAYRARKNKL